MQRSLDGSMPGYPKLYIPFVDVRDVAAAHVLAMTTPGAAGQRFLLSDGPAIMMKQVGVLLKANLGYAKKVSNDKARRVLGFQPRQADEAILAAATTMLDKSLVKK